ncbi:MAG: hypothetical protein ACRDP4_12790 [Nocardioidaceae bacterium]
MLAELSEQVPGASPEDLAETPFVLVGSVEEMAEQLLRQSDQLGITRYVVREGAIDPVESVLPLLSDHQWIRYQTAGRPRRPACAVTAQLPTLSTRSSWSHPQPAEATTSVPVTPGT